MIRKKRRIWKAFQNPKQFQKFKKVQQAVKTAKRKVENNHCCKES